MKVKSDITRKWKKIGQPKIIFKKFGKYVIKQNFELPKNKKKIDFYFIGKADSASIFALTKEGRVVVSRQYRPNVDCFVDELPAGEIDEGETPKETIIRELKEETGHKVGKIVYLGFFPLSNPNSFTKLHCFLGLDCEKSGNQKLDENEDVSVILMEPKQWLKKVVSGNRMKILASPAAIINTFWALSYLNEGKNLTFYRRT